MSEYQYYEFQTIDRPLTENEMEKISKLSSRVELSATRAVFYYNYSNFPADPEEVLLNKRIGIKQLKGKTDENWRITQNN